MRSAPRSSSAVEQTAHFNASEDEVEEMSATSGDLRIENSPTPSLKDFGEHAAWFREELARRDVGLVGGSALDRVLTEMSQISEHAQVRMSVTPERAAELTELLRQPDIRAKARQMLLDGVGGASLVRAIRKAVARNPNVFDGKWDLFRGADVILTRADGRVPQRDLVWELYLATICLQLSPQVYIAANDNPDIRCTVRGTNWGLECKLFDSPSVRRHVKNIEKAAQQIQASTVERGVVAVNLTPVLDHRKFHDSLSSFGTTMFTEAEILRDLRDQVQNIVDDIKASEAAAGWANKYPKARALFLQAQTIALAGKTLSMTTYRDWVPLVRRDGADFKMEGRFERAAQAL